MSKSTKTTQENKPPAWAKPLFKESAKDATRLYNSGSGFNVYGGQTIADQSGATTGGLNRLEQAARGPMQGLAGNAVGTLGNYDDAYNKLEATASGKMLQGNPYLDRVIDRTSRDTASMVNSSMSGSGRYGSGAHTGVLADRIGGIQDQMRSDNYRFERGNQLNAINNQAAITGNKLAGVGQAMGMQAMPGNMLLNVGRQRDAREQALLDDAQRRFTQKDMQDWTRLGALQAAAQGAAGAYGTMVNTTKQPMNPMQIIGGLGSLAMPFMSPLMGMGMGTTALGAMGPQYSMYGV